MRISEMYPSKYLKAADINGERTLTISNVVYEEVGQDREKKPVVQFSDESKSLVLNKTNALRLEFVAGSDDTGDWRGLEITLYTELVSFGGKSGPAIRVKNTRVPKPATATSFTKATKSTELQPPPWLDDPQDPANA
jgi:hypothetical protein